MGWKTGIALAFGLFLALSAAPAAQAMCLNNCIPNCGGYDSTCLNICEDQFQQCLKQENSAGSFGAIAYGPTSGRWGWSYHWGTKTEAEHDALKNCQADDCKVVAWFDHECGAVAADDATGDYGYDSGTTKEGAESSAQSHCAAAGGKACKVLISACSF